ncbi:methylmalonyl-CoA mutase family protein [Fulvivirga ligni]|uniref:methylmalonyl-CoA mutase family protein n=1 Tax=Fulvivirga ligni TaxID=2904246 RepID=UPI001F3A999D|nr:methylmalonyl-CoA mutase family protein [Fulvivirga ligni]UII23132.1 methylmalonyl-CoA mutase family protein [Fulvivirga ligni]
MSNRHKELFKDFKSNSKDEWLKVTEKDLKGNNVFEQYSWQPDPKITLNPYYDNSDITFKQSHFDNRLFNNRETNGESRYWDNFQLLKVNSEKEANEIALAALNNGATGIIFDLEKNKIVNFDELLKDILPAYCNISLMLSENAKTHLNNYVSFLADSNFKAEDIVGLIMSSNSDEYLSNTNLEAFPHLKSIQIELPSDLSFTESVAHGLTSLVHTIENLTDEGVTSQQIFDSLFINVPLSTGYFEEIARIKAIRRLVYQIAQAYGHESFLPEDLYILGTSHAWNNEAYEPQANLLKSTTACMAAIIGGCNGILIKPSDEDSSLLKRMAVNTSLILKEEAYLNKVNDPVAGSYYLETLIDQISQQAWTEFQSKLNEE